MNGCEILHVTQEWVYYMFDIFQPFLVYFAWFCVFMQLLHWITRWAFSVNTTIKAGPEDKNRNNVIIIGAGFSGIGLAVFLKLAGIKFVILEKAPHVGGTWWYNDYPGAKVDVKSHTYCYSFFPKTSWKDIYSFRDEILQYIVDTVTHFGLKPHLRLSTAVKNGEWNPEERQWVVTTIKGEVFKAKFLANCMGFLHKPNMPKIAGVEKFKGRIFHTAQWQHDFDITGKKVAVVGSGCSAIQVVPEIAKIAKEVTMFQRSPSVIIQKTDDGQNSTLDRAVAFLLPWVQWVQRIVVYLQTELFYWGWNSGWFGDKVKKGVFESAVAQLTDKDLIKEMIIPANKINGCKRPALYTDFYKKFETLGVKLQTQAVKEVTENGVRLDSGDILEVDLIILATGFDMLHYKDVPMKAHGKTFEDVWGDLPYAYQGLLHPNFPNYFALLGPQSGILHGPGSVYMGEMQTELCLNVIRKMTEENHGTFNLKQNALDAWIDEYNRHLKAEKSWLFGCSSWYNNHGGTPWQPYIWHTYKLMAECKWPKLDNLLEFA